MKTITLVWRVIRDAFAKNPSPWFDQKGDGLFGDNYHVRTPRPSQDKGVKTKAKRVFQSTTAND